MPNNLGRLCDKHPIFSAYNGQISFLSNEDAERATVDERIRSVWPFLVRRVLDFQKSLKPRERVNFDPEDTLAELWIALAKRDHKWTPSRGKYITFAGAIADHALCDIRDRSHTVESPRNSHCRLKEYEAEEAAGTITPKRAKTFDDIRRSSGAFKPIEGNDERASDNTVITVIEQEAKTLARDAVVQAIRCLEPFEAKVVGATHGLWGQPIKTIAEIAATTGHCPDGVKKAKGRAMTKIRDRLQELGHPAVTDPSAV